MFVIKEEISLIKISKDCSIKESIAILEKQKRGIVIIVDDKDSVLGTLTDGDIRRSIIRGVSMDDLVEVVMNKSPKVAQSKNEIELRELSMNLNLENIPIVNENNKLTGLYSILPANRKQLDVDIIPNAENFCAFILAGGEGKRMRPMTYNKPKPLVNVGKKSLLERNIDLIQSSGITNIFISVNYMAEKIIHEIGDGSERGLIINYLEEKEKLGTGAPIGLLPKNTFEHVLVMNADILTSLSLSKLINAHINSRSDASIVITERDTQIPFGVIELDEHEKPIRIQEKPKIKHFCAAGIYLLKSEVANTINATKYKDMPDILNEFISNNYNVNVFPLFPLVESWSDIGTKEALEDANKQ